MFKLQSSIIKELRLLSRDRVGLLLMFIMPVFLAIVMTAIQDSTFKLVNDNKMSLVICNRDKDDTADEFIEAVQNTGLFSISVTDVEGDYALKQFSKTKNALATLIIPEGMFKAIKQKAAIKASKALVDFGIRDSVKEAPVHSTYVVLMKVIFKPVLQDTYRYSVKASINSIVQIITNKLMIRSLYSDINQKEITPEMEEKMLPEDISVEELDSNNTFHGVPDKSRLARAVAAVLQPNGRFAVINWHRRSREETIVLGQPRGPKTEMRMTPEDAKLAGVGGNGAEGRQE